MCSRCGSGVPSVWQNRSSLATFDVAAACKRLVFTLNSNSQCAVSAFNRIEPTLHSVYWAKHIYFNLWTGKIKPLKIGFTLPKTGNLIFGQRHLLLQSLVSKQARQIQDCLPTRHYDTVHIKASKKQFQHKCQVQNCPAIEIEMSCPNFVVYVACITFSNKNIVHIIRWVKTYLPLYN